jgi:exo-beta-1,3-glucanase (GH17 family)
MARNMAVVNEILNCKSTEEVNSIIDDINMSLKSVRDTINSKKKFQFSVGNTVLVNEKNGRTSEGKILKINRSRAKVEMNGLTYNVPFSIMQLQEAS